MNYFYGDNVRWFIGTVLDVYNDPLERGRVQIRIHGIHSEDTTDIALADFPWAEVLIPTTEGGVSGIGQGPGILETAQVFGIFLDGKESQMPLVLGSLTHNEVINPGDRRDQTLYSQGNTSASDPFSLYQGIVTTEELRNTLASNPGDVRTKRLILMKFFMSQSFETPDGPKPRFTQEMAAGIVGNLQGENSTFDPKRQSGIPSTRRTSTFNETFPSGIGDIENPSNEPSFGLAQWNANVGRFQQLFEYSKKRGVPWDDFFLQAEFICHTLYGTGTRKDGASLYHNSVYKPMLRASQFDGGAYNSNSTTWIWLDIYENPAGKDKEIIKREKYAYEALQDFRAAITQSQPKAGNVS